MIALRNGVLIGLVYTLPVTVWLLAQAYMASTDYLPVNTIARSALLTLLGLQAMFVIVCIPGLLGHPDRYAHMREILMLLLVPAPVLAITWLMGAANASGLLAGILLLMGFSLVAYLFFNLVLQIIPHATIRRVTLLFAQVLLVMLVWRFRSWWAGII